VTVPPYPCFHASEKGPLGKALHDPALGQRSREEAAVGRHAAGDGDSVHPVVAAALARRTADTAAPQHGPAAGPPAPRPASAEPDATQRIDGSLGWPGEPPAPGGGLGWPGDLTPSVAETTGSGETDLSAEVDDDQSEDPVPDIAPGGRRRGWRRLLGLDPAAA
jgi:hypothetical protein